MSYRQIFINSGIICSAVFLLANSLFINGYGNNRKKDKETVEAEILVKKYCMSCCAYISPQLLDKETWQKSVLPAMGKKPGISTCI